MTEEEVSQIRTFLAMFCSPVVRGGSPAEPEPKYILSRGDKLHEINEPTAISSLIMEAAEAATIPDGVASITMAGSTTALLQTRQSMSSTFQDTEAGDKNYLGPSLPLRDATNMIEELVSLTFVKHSRNS